MEASPADPGPVRSGPPAIDIAGLTRYFGGFRAVSALDLTVNRGEILSLLGPNGAGKTTTIKMLMGLLVPTSGSASVFRHDCFSERATVMRSVGYVPDEPVFYDYLTGREIVDFVGEMHGYSVPETRIRCAPLFEELSLADALDEYAVNYSKGMRKKLGMVCALLHDPSVLILDELTNGLDPFATRTIHGIVRRRVEDGAAVFFSTHLLDQAERLSDRVAILYEGRLAAVGPITELRDRLAPGGSLEQIFFAVTEGSEG